MTSSGEQPGRGRRGHLRQSNSLRFALLFACIPLESTGTQSLVVRMVFPSVVSTSSPTPLCCSCRQIGRLDMLRAVIRSLEGLASAIQVKPYN